MKTTNTTGLSRAALTAAGVVRPVITLDSLRLDAKSTNIVQVVAYAGDTSRWLLVLPGGSVFGTGEQGYGAFDAEALADHVVAKGQAAGQMVRWDEVAK